jgi:hypothetical protein
MNENCPKASWKVEKRVNQQMPFYVMICLVCEKKCERLPTPEERRELGGWTA